MSIKLEGRIVGPWVAEFDRTWHSLASSLDGKKLSVDLRGVTYIDSEGREVLAEIVKTASFVAKGFSANCRLRQ